jgi:hypothetical protein
VLCVHAHVLQISYITGGYLIHFQSFKALPYRLLSSLEFNWYSSKSIRKSSKPINLRKNHFIMFFFALVKPSIWIQVGFALKPNQFVTTVGAQQRWRNAPWLGAGEPEDELVLFSNCGRRRFMLSRSRR